MALGQDIATTYTSLSGFKGGDGKGLIVERPDAVVAFTTGVELLHSNPLRKWALIQNQGAAITFSFDTGTGIAPTMILQPGGVIQIDDNLPWCGAVYLAAAAGSVSWMEASNNEQLDESPGQYRKSRLVAVSIRRE
jgi:hypothetical protein